MSEGYLKTILPLENDLQSQFCTLREVLSQQVVGQPELINHLLIALLSDGHILVEGPPGLAKTRVVKTLSDSLEGSFQRIQFTPDLLPTDVTGCDIFRPETGEFHFKSGPIFHTLLLADEINRAPAKVQSAMLEAMAEKQVTISGITYPLPALFMVIATQNPIEQEGTYPLPEAQLDRFLMQINVGYPDATSERAILRLNHDEVLQGHTVLTKPLSQKAIFTARREIMQLPMSEAVEDYIIRLIMATREPENYDEQLAQWLNLGVSPRATLALYRSARAHAWLQGQQFVTPMNVVAVAHAVLAHRLVLSYDALAEGINRQQIIDRLLQLVVSA